jgi:hypothetical protein
VGAFRSGSRSTHSSAKIQVEGIGDGASQSGFLIVEQQSYGVADGASALEI